MLLLRKFDKIMTFFQKFSILTSCIDLYAQLLPPKIYYVASFPGLMVSSSFGSRLWDIGWRVSLQKAWGTRTAASYFLWHCHTIPVTLACSCRVLRVVTRGHIADLSLCKYRRGGLEVLYLWESAISDIFYIEKSHNISFVSLFPYNFLQCQYINFRTPICKLDCRCVCRTPALISSRVLRVLSQEVGGRGSIDPGLLGADTIPGMLMPIAIRGRNLKTWVRGYTKPSKNA